MLLLKHLFHPFDIKDINILFWYAILTFVLLKCLIVVWVHMPDSFKYTGCSGKNCSFWPRELFVWKIINHKVSFCKEPEFLVLGIKDQKAYCISLNELRYRDTAHLFRCPGSWLGTKLHEAVAAAAAAATRSALKLERKPNMLNIFFLIL